MVEHERPQVGGAPLTSVAEFFQNSCLGLSLIQRDEFWKNSATTLALRFLREPY